jgi:hypothetical protein
VTKFLSENPNQTDLGIESSALLLTEQHKVQSQARSITSDSGSHSLFQRKYHPSHKSASQLGKKKERLSMRCHWLTIKNKM